MSAVGGCKAAVTARTRCAWVKLRECGELLHSRRFLLQLKWAVYASYLRSEILYGSETLCLKESEMGVLQKNKRSMVREMYGVHLNDRKLHTDLMLMLGLSELIDKFAKAGSVRWYGHVLRREDGHVL